MPDAETNEKNERAYGIFVQRGQVRHGGQLLSHDPAKVNRGQNEQASGLNAEVRRQVGEGEGHEAEHAYEKDEHVGVVEKVAGSTRDRRGKCYARSLVVVPHVYDRFLLLFDVLVQVPLLLLLEIVRVYGGLVGLALHEVYLLLVTRRGHCDAQVLHVYEYLRDLEK